MTGLIFNQQLEVQKPRTVESAYSSEPVLDWSDPVWETVPFAVSVQQISSSEGDVERPQTITSLVLVTPPGTDIPALEAKSRLRVGGVMVVEVVGEPAHWPDPWTPGAVHHLEADLEVVHG